MSTVTITVNVGGLADEADRRTMVHIIGVHNNALSPTGVPLPSGTNAERRSSYETILNSRIREVHNSYLREADTVTKRELLTVFENADETKRAAMLAAGQ